MYRKLLLLPCLLFLFYHPGKSQPRKDVVITIFTPEGNMVVLLYEKTPLHKDNFYKLAKSGFYNGTTFHRIIQHFMIQGGDPNSRDSIKGNEGVGGPGYTIPAEIVRGLTHTKGALAAARLGDNQNPERASSGSQFYIVQNPEGTPHLDNQYTVFGQVIEGMEVIDKIAQKPKDYNDRPKTDIPMRMAVKKMRTKKIIQKYHCESFYTK